VDLPLFPLNTVLFPGGHLPLHIFEERYKQMIADCLAGNRPFGVCLIREGNEVGAPAEPFAFGTTAHIRSVEELEEARLNIVCTGGQRFRLREITARVPYLTAEVTVVEPEDESGEELDDLAGTAGALFAEYVRLNLASVNQWARGIEMPADPGGLADFIGGRLGVDVVTKQRLLEQLSPTLRLQAEIEILAEAIRVLEPRVRVARAQRWTGFGVLN
jgi:Lon protease-like protein